MPPPAVRRSVSVTVGLILCAAVLIAGPLLLAGGWLARLLGHPKPLIAVRLSLIWCMRELGVMSACAGLWIAGALGTALRRPAFDRAHWALLHWYVHGIARAAQRRLNLAIREECPGEAAGALSGSDPVIVFSRHAGPGDTIFLIDRLMSVYRRRPTVVLRKAITFDPAIGLLVERLPQGAIDQHHGNGEPEALICALAAGLGPRGALLLYPEGGNFTRSRRRRALASLRRRGRHRAAVAAQQMANVLPPRPAGVLAALRGRPEARVLFVAHTGLGLAAYPREIYRDLPIGRTLRFRVWPVDPAEIPAGEDERVAWLNRWWQTIDRWVRGQHGEPMQ